MRYLEVIPLAGELVLSRDGGGGLRHFLDGRPVECGAELVHVGIRPGDGSTFYSRARAPARVRYESRLDGRECAVILHAPDGSERFARPTDVFEWPASGARRGR